MRPVKKRLPDERLATAFRRQYGLTMPSPTAIGRLVSACAQTGFIVAASIALAPVAGFADEMLERQRAAFRDVYPKAELGMWQPVEEQQELLSDYALWPDLRAAWLRSRPGILKDDEIRIYLEDYDTLKPARDLRYRYALHLAEDGRLLDYFAIYERYYQGLNLARLDCHALNAEMNNGRQKRVAGRATELWLVGRSQVDACDPVFDRMRETGVIGPRQHAERFELAVQEKQFSLARWLAKSLDETYQDEARRWIAAQNDPRAFASNYRQYPDDESHRKQLLYATQRIAYRDPLAATEHWALISDTFTFSAEQRYRLLRYKALWAARRHLPEAHGMLGDLGAPPDDTEVLRWLARSAMLAGDWESVLAHIEAMQAEEKSAEEWLYWRAHALKRTGAEDRARMALQEIATERSYYGFMAADDLGLGYEFSHENMASDEDLIRELARRDEIIRARELFFVGLDSRGRSEWDAAVAYLDADEKPQAAILADRWGWHSRAISAAAKSGQYDDLEIRYPLPYREQFEAFAEAASIRDSWAFAIARSESVFMRDVRSSAGAVGLMQLMPATGKETAKEIDLEYAGLITLTDPASNIRLGTTYLGMMYEKFEDHRVLATAAYNAGPANVESWLPRSVNVDARIWIENIPFNETRKYVRRVLETDIVFHWRMTGEVRRIDEEFQPIRTIDKQLRAAN